MAMAKMCSKATERGLTCGPTRGQLGMIAHLGNVAGFTDRELDGFLLERFGISSVEYVRTYSVAQKVIWALSTLHGQRDPRAGFLS